MHISIVDIIILVLIVGSVFRGYQIGFIRQLSSTIGFIIGLYPGSVISSVAMSHIDGPMKPLAGLSILLAVCFVFMTVGELIAVRVRHSLRNKWLRDFDDLLGSFIAVVTLLLGVWLANALFQLAPSSTFQSLLKDSRILGYLDRSLPPASNMLSSLNKLIDPNNSPQVFAGREPSPTATYTLPNPDTHSAILSAIRPSVVKIEGLGCGGVVDGSGWVAGPDRVVTNAHVVAGVRSPKISDANGVHDTSVVLFDPTNDIAMLRTSDLAGKPLGFSIDTMKSATEVFALGYPGGGKYTVQPGVVLDEFTALGQDIYGKQRTVRSVYSVQTTIVPGNSGGPIVDTSGTVRAVVFATSTTYNNVGYALTMAQ
ncbi:MarP family serine protease, partial [Candidatus Saccharibacteria bacterium]|nr:MarP family serine protease [Candidatus Saccharibacteria bacterium]